MILHLNHIPAGKSAQAVSDLTSLVAGSLAGLAGSPTMNGGLRHVPRVHLDWIHYKANFREAIIVRHIIGSDGTPKSIAEIAIDLRQAERAALLEQLTAAFERVHNPAQGHIYLDSFTPWRTSIIWKFNRLFWRCLGAWEEAAGHGFDASLPSGSSDANHPEAIADAVAEFWSLLADLDSQGRLPPQIVVLEIGGGSGVHAKAWLDRFRDVDEQRGTCYYRSLTFVLGDYSQSALDRAVSAVADHRDRVRGVTMEATNPFKSLPALQSQVLHVHLTNVYDNLPFDELVRRDGRLYIVETRGYIPAAAADTLCGTYAITAAELHQRINRLVEDESAVGIARDDSVAFWRDVWSALRLEERLRELESSDHSYCAPPALTKAHIADLLADAPEDVRFHISRGAVESFANTLPLLHPRGCLQVQDIFVREMQDYRMSFRGPGKLDGSLLAWVNGALLRAVGARSGYGVQFAPFKYRAGSNTTIMCARRQP
jgi:hypothetical protein